MTVTQWQTTSHATVIALDSELAAASPGPGQGLPPDHRDCDVNKLDFGSLVPWQAAVRRWQTVVAAAGTLALSWHWQFLTNYSVSSVQNTRANHCKTIPHYHCQRQSRLNRRWCALRNFLFWAERRSFSASLQIPQIRTKLTHLETDQ